MPRCCGGGTWWPARGNEGGFWTSTVERQAVTARRRSGVWASGRELVPLLARVWRASDYLSGRLLVAILPRLLAALAQPHGVGVAPPLRSALTATSPAILDRLLRPLAAAARPPALGAQQQ